MTTTLTWARARTLADLAELTAAWLAGTIPDHPGWVGRPDPETSLIADHLIALGGAGWLTIDSQPGHERDEDGYLQRNAVKLILTPEQTKRLQDTVDHTRYLRSRPMPLVPQTSTDHLQADPVMVSGVLEDDDYIEGTCWFGTGPDQQWELLFGGDSMRPELRRALETAVVVAIADPRWGSADDGLWDALYGLVTERREVRVETLCSACDSLVEPTVAARLDPASPGGVVCTGPTWDQCPDCAQTVTIPDCRTAGHSWTELTAAGQSIVVCPICTQSRAAAPLALVGGARSDSYAAV